MKILVLGAEGQVGYELARRLRGDVALATRAQADLADLSGLERYVDQVGPDVIVNAAAYNAVDRAESEPEMATRINGEAVGLLGDIAKRRGAALVHYSTDFVFDGTKNAPYVETDEPNPLSAYGRSKLAGERALSASDAPALVLRTAWVYSLRRKSFVSVMLKLAREHETLRVVSDQVGSPTAASDLAEVTRRLIEKLGPSPGARAREHRGIYHAAGGGSCSRYELACAAIELDPHKEDHRVRRIEPAESAEFPAPAARPVFAPLDCSKLAERLGVTLLPWRDALYRELTRGERSASR